MGLFGKTCPLRKSYVAIYGIQPPHKFKEEMDCPICEFTVDDKCNFNQIMAQRETWKKRGQPVLVKKSMLTQPPAVREKAESAAVQKAGLNPDEQKEYWQVSREYDRQWETASAKQKSDIMDSLDQWKVQLEKGESPAAAQEKVKEWLQKRAKFRNQGQNS